MVFEDLEDVLLLAVVVKDGAAGFILLHPGNISAQKEGSGAMKRLHRRGCDCKGSEDKNEREQNRAGGDFHRDCPPRGENVLRFSHTCIK
jgi:hypothetical protein